MGLTDVIGKILPPGQYRSDGEIAIARYLEQRGIRFIYEQPLVIHNGRFNERFLPDFTLPDFDKYIEYWGMVDKSPAYVRKMRYKMAIYHRNDIVFLSLYPSEVCWNRFQAKVDNFLGI